jgi:hypothetical protein
MTLDGAVPPLPEHELAVSAESTTAATVIDFMTRE